MIDGFKVIDLHVHSHLSGCADDPPAYTPQIILRHAGEAGIDGVGFADHVLEPQPDLPPELVADLDARPGLERVDALRRYLSRVDLSGRPQVSIGAEVEAWGDGVFAITPAGRSKLDHAVFSANHAQCAGVRSPAGDRPEDFARYILNNTREAIESGLATSIGHPLLGLNRPRPKEVYALHPKLGVEELFEQARDAGVAFGFSRHLLDSHLARRKDIEVIYRSAVRVGVKLAFETDSHRIEHISCIGALVKLAGDIGLKPEHFVQQLPGPVSG